MEMATIMCRHTIEALSFSGKRNVWFTTGLGGLGGTGVAVGIGVSVVCNLSWNMSSWATAKRGQF